MVTQEDHRTLCSICGKACDRSVPYSGNCSSFTPYDAFEESRMYYNKPSFIPMEEPRQLSPKEYGTARLIKRKKRRR